VWSNTQYFACANVPSAPAQPPQIESSTDSSITISWSSPSSNGGSQVTGYFVYMNAINVGEWIRVYDGTGQPTVFTFEVIGLVRGMQYRFMTSAINSVGVGANSTETIMLCAATPSAPG